MPQTTPVPDTQFLDAITASLPGRFPGALRPGPGLSFSHSGLPNEEVMRRFQIVSDVSETDDQAHPVRRVILEDPGNGLQVTLAYTAYPEHNAIIYGATLFNGGRRNIEHLRNLCSYDTRFSPLQQLGAPRVHTIGGGMWENYYPTPAYELRERRLLGPGGFTIDSGPTGRSSNKDLPFFFIEDGEGSSGIYAGIEWSGLWHVTFTRRDEPDQVHYGHLGSDKSLAIQGGMDEVDLLLCTGESFRMPRVLLGFYAGSIASGRNALRRFLNDWMPPLRLRSEPTLDGEPWLSPVQATPGGYICPTELTTDAQCRAHIAANAEVGVEYYVIECWFQSLADRAWNLGATGGARGTWRPDTSRFPDMKALADTTRSLGMKFGLWTDMEVAHAESEVAREHPDWVLYIGGNPNGLLNLAVREAQDWAIGVYDRLIDDYGVEWIFYDNNISPRPYWDANEPAQRHGRLHHDYIRGVWRVWEETIRRHPNVVFENCSSGGRRIDLGTLARSHCSFTSDQFRDKHMIRFQFSGANTVLPGSRILGGICKGLTSYSPYDWQANFAGMIALSEGVEEWSPEMRREARQHLDVYKSIRGFLAKDYYPLFAQPRSLEEWDGWQFHDPATGEGFVLAFRVQSPQETASPRLAGLDAGRTYMLTDPYTGREEVLSGDQLLRVGLQMTLPFEGTRLLRYRPS